MRRRTGFGAGQLICAPVRRRKSRALLSLGALALGAGLITVLLTLERGVEHNLDAGFQRYGANLMVLPAGAEPAITPAAAAPVLAAFPDGVGVLYGVGTANGHAAAIAGADLAELRRLNPEWKVNGDPAPDAGSDAVWIGVNAARLLHLRAGDTVEVSATAGQQRWRVAGTVQSGGSEDNQILAPYAAAARLVGAYGYSALALRVDAAAMPEALGRVHTLLPEARAEPVRQITAGEGAILLSTRNLLLVCMVLILFTVGLCVAASLTTLALQRRRDFGLMKALGGGEGAILRSFVGEAALLGIAAAVIGVAAGALVAGLMGQALFHVWLVPSLTAAVAAVALTVALAGLAALGPWPILHAATPAAILRGE